MSFDPRSLERLRQLGRSLPQPLPAPDPPAAAPPDFDKTSRPRHRLETETDPEALFHELMRASADGSAPPHLLERLRQLEAQRAGSRQTESRQAESQQAVAGSPPVAASGSRRERRGRLGRNAEQDELYTQFQQLLLEDDEI